MSMTNRRYKLVSNIVIETMSLTLNCFQYLSMTMCAMLSKVSANVFCNFFDSKLNFVGYIVGDNVLFNLDEA